MELIDEVIEQSALKFNPRLTATCLELIRLMNKEPPPDRKCWRFMQILFLVNKCMPMNLTYYWYKEGIVVDPAALIKVTGGIIKFRYDDECKGCQIETECPCEGNPFHERNPTTKYLP